MKAKLATAPQQGQSLAAWAPSSLQTALCHCHCQRMSITASTLHLMATVPSETWFVRRAVTLSQRVQFFFWAKDMPAACALLVTPSLTRSPCPAQVQDRAVQSSEQWQEGSLLFERLQTLPNYEKCAWLLLAPLCLEYHTRKHRPNNA